jgi:hypothetical protein
MLDFSNLNFSGALSDAVDKFTAGVSGLLPSTGPAESVGGGSGIFPGNLSASYHMNLVFYQYRRTDMNSIGTAQELNRWKLPIPANMSDAQGVDYGEEAVGTSLGGSASAVMGADPNATAASTAGEAAKAVGIGGAAGTLQAFKGAYPLASAKYGITANPFMTVMFKSPKYKTHDFSWRFFPRNPQESQSLMKLITTIRYHQLPARSTAAGGAILTYPSLIKPQIIAGGTNVYPFKYGVIAQSAFNFSPDGVPAFHRGGSPTAVDVKISIQEVEYFLKNSFTSSS